MIAKIQKLTKMSIEIQNQQLRIFARVDFDTKLEIIKHQKTLFHRFKNLNQEFANSELTLVTLILSIKEKTSSLDKVNLNVIKLRGKNIKQKIKREKLLGYWAIVKTLKSEKNMSFRDIETYFVKYHKFNVSYSTIQKLWTELEQKNKEKSQ